MSEPITNPVDLIAHRILDAILSDKDVKGDHVFEALKGMFVTWLACCCPDCRRSQMRNLRCDLPAMLNKANQLAAEHPERQRYHTTH